jgi:glucose-6-phosphate isomerase, archaeal
MSPTTIIPMNSQNFGEIPHIQWSSGNLVGNNVRETVKTFGQLQGLFQHGNDLEHLDLNTIVYRVHWYAPVPEGTEGGLFWGTTVIEPGRVGDEYFMTHGHFHVKRDRAEYYACIEGRGMLIMMDTARRTWAEGMAPGGLHYIPGNIAHRVANTGQAPLKFVACWPSDAGHDYEAIRERGFGARVFERNGEPVLVRTE